MLQAPGGAGGVGGAGTGTWAAHLLSQSLAVYVPLVSTLQSLAVHAYLSGPGGGGGIGGGGGVGVGGGGTGAVHLLSQSLAVYVPLVSTLQSLAVHAYFSGAGAGGVGVGAGGVGGFGIGPLHRWLKHLSH